MFRDTKGYDFSIRTPGTPARWADYDAEMAAAWQVCSFDLIASNALSAVSCHTKTMVVLGGLLKACV